MSAPEPLLDVAHGDPARSKILRDSLRILREKSDVPAFKALVDEILAGRKGLRETAREPLFGKGVAAGVDAGAAWWAGLSPEEREELAEQGRQQIVRLRYELAHPDRVVREADADYEFDPGDPLRRKGL